MTTGFQVGAKDVLVVVNVDVDVNDNNVVIVIVCFLPGWLLFCFVRATVATSM